MGNQLLVQWTTQYFSLYQDCHHLSAAFLSSASRSTDQSHHSRKLGPLFDPVTARSDKHACGKPMLTDHDKQATENREPANEMNKEDPTQGIPVWLQPFTVNLEDLEAHVLAHSSERERTQIRKVMCQKWRHKNGSTSVHASFRKNQKTSTLRTEKYGDLITAEHKVLNEGRESRNNHRYAVVVQVLATQWNPCHTKTSQETEKNSRKFTEPSQKPKVTNTDNLIEFWQVL